jgi:hypothetical protein
MEVQRHTQISTPFFACVFQFHKGIPTVLQGASASLILEKQFLLLALRSPLAPLKLHQKFPAVGHDGGFASFVLLTRKERGINDPLDGPEAAGERGREKRKLYIPARRGVQKEPPTCVPQFWCSRRTYCGIFML